MFQISADRLSPWNRIAVGATAILLSGLLLTDGVQAQSEPNEASLREFLQNYLKIGTIVDNTARYSVASASLGNKGQSLVVYITGNAWCGSGGCTAIIVQPEGKSFRVINKMTLARLPIRVLPTKTHGWHDLAMPVRGGGATSSRFALLKFNGAKYPSNPSTAPLAKSADLAKGDPLPLKEAGDPVY